MTTELSPGNVRLNDGLGPNAQDLTGDVAWLWTHCRALGMTRRSDSGLMRDDVALYAADLHALLHRALPALREYARANPRHHFGETPQDPNGVHALLADLGA